jgi:hypothetical protein
LSATVGVKAFPALSAVVRAHRLDDFVLVDVLGSGPAAATAYTPAPMIIKEVVILVG